MSRDGLARKKTHLIYFKRYPREGSIKLHIFGTILCCFILASALPFIILISAIYTTANYTFKASTSKRRNYGYTLYLRRHSLCQAARLNVHLTFVECFLTVYSYMMYSNKSDQNMKLAKIVGKPRNTLQRRRNVQPFGNTGYTLRLVSPACLLFELHCSTSNYIYNIQKSLYAFVNVYVYLK